MARETANSWGQREGSVDGMYQGLPERSPSMPTMRALRERHAARQRSRAQSGYKNKTGVRLRSTARSADYAPLMPGAGDLEDLRGVAAGGVGQDDDGGSHGRSYWWQTAAIIVANFLGTGVLSLPHAFALLGWIPGFVFLVIFFFGSVYSGVLLSRLRTHFPRAQVYADLGEAAMGKAGKALVAFVGYTYVGLCCVVFHLTLTKALEKVVGPDAGICVVYLSLIVAAVIYPLAQVRSGGR